MKQTKKNALYAAHRAALIPKAAARAEVQVSRGRDFSLWSTIFSEEMDRLAHERLGVTAGWLLRELRLEGRCPRCGRGGEK